MDKEYYIVIFNFTDEKYMITTHKSDFKKLVYKVYVKIHFISNDEIELLSDFEYTEHLEKEYRIFAELLKKNYNLFIKNQKIKLTKSIDFNKNINNQFANININSIDSINVNNKWVNFNNLLNYLKKLLG